jgi:hypothetical protein
MVIAPGRSTRFRRPSIRCRLFGTTRRAPTIARTAIGTFTRKTARQSSHSVSTPPARMPAALPDAVTALNEPSALARSPTLSKVTMMIDNTAGETRAPPSPCTARPTINVDGF